MMILPFTALYLYAGFAVKAVEPSQHHISYLSERGMIYNAAESRQGSILRI
jgi:hypothetical protein